MNEKEFLKKINKENNLSGDLTYAIVKQLLEESNKPINKSNESFLKRIINRFTNKKSAEKIIERNFEMILEKTYMYHIEPMIEEFMNNPELKQVLRNNFVKAVQIVSNKSTYVENISEQIIENFEYKSKDRQKFIIENLEDIMESIQPKDVWGVVNKIKQFAPQTARSLLNSYLEKNKFAVCRSLLSKLDCMKEDIEEFENTILIIIEELLENENKQFIDIKYLGEGAFTKAYQIGNKVVKIGDNRITHEIPNHPRILQPLVKTPLVTRKGVSAGCIEVTRKAIPAKPNDKDIATHTYELYKELRNSGIYCADIKLDNLGWITENDNIYNINGQELFVFPESVGFDKNLEHKENDNHGKKLVILDLDMIYKCPPDEDPIEEGNYISKKLECLYQEEKGGEEITDELIGEVNEEETPIIENDDEEYSR